MDIPGCVRTLQVRRTNIKSRQYKKQNLTGSAIGLQNLALFDIITASKTCVMQLFIFSRTLSSHGLGWLLQHTRQLNATSSGMYTTNWYISSTITTRTAFLPASQFTHITMNHYNNITVIFQYRNKCLDFSQIQSMQEHVK